MNNTILAGRITKNLELRYTPSNKAVLEVPLAINNSKDDTTFIKVTVFGNIAETVNKYCKKGDMIGVQAMVKNHNWIDKNGNNHYDYSFIANKITFLQTKAKNEVEKQEEKKDKYNNAFEEFGEQIEINDNFLD